MFVDVFALLLILLALYKCRFFKCNEYNSDNLNIENSSCVKAVFCFVVIFCHLTNITESGKIFWIFDSLGTFAVAVFLFLSGYGLMKQHLCNQKYQEHFLKKRLVKILVPYLIVLLMYITYYLYIGYDISYIFKLSSNLFILGDSIVENSWYVFIIIELYLLFFIGIRIFKNDKNKILLFIFICTLLHIYLSITFRFSLCWYITIICFVLGIAYASYEIKIKEILVKKYSLFFLIFSSLLLMLFLLNIKYIEYCDNLYFYILKYSIFVLIIIILTMKVQLGNTILKFVYNISYELYLTHGLVIMLFKNVIINDFMLCLLVILCSMAISFLTKKIDKYLIKCLLH